MKISDLKQGAKFVTDKNSVAYVLIEQLEKTAIAVAMRGSDELVAFPANAEVIGITVTDVVFAHWS